MKCKILVMLGACLALLEITFLFQGSLSQFHIHDAFLSRDAFLRRKQSPLNDQTLNYNHTVRRAWLDSALPDPPAMILLTDLAWNQENQTMGKSIYRGARTRELYEGIINHPWFHPTAWRELSDGSMALSNTTRYYVFLDRETAGEKNWPYYGRGVITNADRFDGRDTCCGFQTLCLEEVMESRVMSATNAKYVLMDGAGWGPRNRFEEARQKYTNNKIVFLSLSARHDQLNLDLDLGLAPPAVKPCRFTAQQRAEAAKCHSIEETKKRRPVLISLLASIRGNARHALGKLHNGKDIIITHDQVDAVKNLHKTNITDPYHFLLTSSQFGAAPRGDNLFSYRFPEVASCGAIPVIYADDWQLPFVQDVVDWQEAAIIISEKDAHKTQEILEAIPHMRRCHLRRKALELYDKHLSTAHKTMATVIDGMEKLAERNTDTFTGDRDMVTESTQGFLKSGLCAPSPITDHTLCYRDEIERLWLGDTKATQPPAMLLLSQYGWNNPTPQKKHPRGTWYRSMRTRELTEGIINHPWFHPDGFEQYLQKKLVLYTTVTYIFFLDMESCGEKSYPYYEGGIAKNADTSGGRTTQWKDRSHRYLKEIWRAVELKGIDFRVVFLDCNRNGPFVELRENNHDPHLALASVSAARSQVVNGFDQGMPLPAYRPFKLTPSQRNDQLCSDEKRPILLSFSGHLYSHPRKLLRELHNDKDVLIGTPDEHRVRMGNSTADPYFCLAIQSQFAAVPRGRHLGTSRLVEMMSTGAIPVIFADDWVLPMDRTIDWSKIAVVLPEDDARHVVEILTAIPAEKRCEMRHEMMTIYEKYLSTGEGIIAGLAEGILATGRISQKMEAPQEL